MLLFCSTINAQQVWYFGQNAGIKFPSSGGGLPTSYASPLTAGNPIKTNEGCAMAFDANGNVLMSTDGSFVYDNTNTAMPNANGDLMGGGSATQSAVFVPVPGCNCSKYFIFTVASLSGGNDANHPETAGLSYSVVDMTLNAGKGDITSSKNIPLVSTSLPNGSKFQGYSSEKLTACKDGNGGYWVVAHGNDKGGYIAIQKRFYAFHITNNSIGNCSNPKVDTTSTNCIITDIGNTLTGSAAVGQMKISPTASKIAYATWGIGTVELFDFNNISGVVSNHRSLGAFSSQPY